MGAQIEEVEACHNVSSISKGSKLRTVAVDGSSEYMETVLALLEFHEIVDLIGRAANFEEAVQLVVNHQPDLVLIDLDMPLANMVIAACVLCTRRPVKTVGMCAAETIPLRALDFITAVNALIRRSRLRQEFLIVVDAIWGGATALIPILPPSEVDQSANQRCAGVQSPPTPY
jgi:DNA-binding NarL/FixJ family response regulator